MHVTHLGDGEERIPDPVAGFDRLRVHPAGGLAVPQHLEIVAKVLCPDSAPLVEQHRDLAQHQSVALDRRGVVGLQVPDVVPDRLRLGRPWETAEPLELGDRRRKAAIDRLPARSAARHTLPVLITGLDTAVRHRTVQDNSAEFDTAAPKRSEQNNIAAGAAVRWSRTATHRPTYRPPGEAWRVTFRPRRPPRGVRRRGGGD